MSEPLPDVDAERERLYAMAKALGLEWARFRRRVYSVPAQDLADVEEDPSESELREIEIETETVALLQQLADLFEGAELRGSDG